MNDIVMGGYFLYIDGAYYSFNILRNKIDQKRGLKLSLSKKCI